VTVLVCKSSVPHTLMTQSLLGPPAGRRECADDLRLPRVPTPQHRADCDALVDRALRQLEAIAEPARSTIVTLEAPSTRSATAPNCPSSCRPMILAMRLVPHRVLDAYQLRAALLEAKRAILRPRLKVAASRVPLCDRQPLMPRVGRLALLRGWFAPR
jgi:hypothetical protein